MIVIDSDILIWLLRGRETIKEQFKKNFGTLICKSILEEFTSENGRIDLKHPDKIQKCLYAVIVSAKEAQKIIDEIE